MSGKLPPLLLDVAVVGGVTERQIDQILNGTKHIESKKGAADFIKYIMNEGDRLTLLSRLTSSSNGMMALSKALSLVSSTDLQLCKTILIPFIRFVASDDQLLCGEARLATRRRLFELTCQVPNLMRNLAFRLVQTGKFNEEEVIHSLYFFIQILMLKEDVKNDEAFQILCTFLSKKAFGSRKVRALCEMFHGLLGKGDNAEVNTLYRRCAQTGWSVDALLSGMPGWRHDNDLWNFRSISIYPTVQEIFCEEPAYLPQTRAMFKGIEQHRNNQGFGEQAHDIYLDWSFRLLRHDIVETVKEEIGLLLREEAKLSNTDRKILDRLKRRSAQARSLELSRKRSRAKPAFRMTFAEPGRLFAELQRCKQNESPKVVREKFWKNSSMFREGSVIAFVAKTNGPVLYKELVGLGVVDSISPYYENGNDLGVDVVVIERAQADQIIKGHEFHGYSLTAYQLDCSFFAYAPVLDRLKQLIRVPFSEELFGRAVSANLPPSYLMEVVQTDLYNRFPSHARPQIHLSDVVDKLEQLPDESDLKALLELPQPLVLDSSQKKAVVDSLKHRVALIQGPPGTGKSFCGSLIGKILHDYSSEKILCLCYTNHALDQYLEDLLKVGTPESAIVRIGNSQKVSEKMQQFSLQSKLFARRRQHRGSYDADRRKRQLDEELGKCQRDLFVWLGRVRSMKSSLNFQSFQNIVEAYGLLRTLNSEEVWNTWLEGGQLQRRYCEYPWNLTKEERLSLLAIWRQILTDEALGEIDICMNEMRELNMEYDSVNRTGTIELLKTMRIIGCTTTGKLMLAAAVQSLGFAGFSGASIRSKELEALGAGVVILEEAGEILEPHVVAALTSKCKHFIMIGDHKQLRPKVECYQLQVESGRPYEFNRSLFERLILSNCSHTTLELQHRMRPDFSELIRRLTYPNLQDAPGTQGRQNITGVLSNLAFITHEHEEGQNKFVPGRPQENDEILSKINGFEAEMSAQIARYFLNQGYENVTVLTPYIGQLKLISTSLARLEVRPKLSGKDSAQLTMNLAKGPACRLSSVDNYQGEEADIVIVSLVRSNENGQVGFVGEPERVNVLLSRARLGMVILGNMRTFEKARPHKARNIWSALLEILSGQGAIFPGFPLTCKVHRPASQDVLMISNPADFSRLSPLGGCDHQCGQYMPCGVHLCPKPCHGMKIHDTERCQVKVEVTCSIKVDVSCGHGHEFQMSCQNSKRPFFWIDHKCPTVVDLPCPTNGHILKLPCPKSRNVYQTTLANLCTVEVDCVCALNSHPLKLPCPSSKNINALKQSCKAEVVMKCRNWHEVKVECPMSDDKELLDRKCKQSMQVSCGNGHMVDVRCCDSRNKCHLREICNENVSLPCTRDPSHTITMPCCDVNTKKSEKKSCQAQVAVTCSQGHEFKVSCQDSKNSSLWIDRSCPAIVDLLCPTNGHPLQLPCPKSKNISQTSLAVLCNIEVDCLCALNSHPLKLPCPSSKSSYALATSCKAEVVVKCGNGHDVGVRCWQSTDRALLDGTCKEPMQVPCGNGHMVDVRCCDSRASKNCKVEVDVQCPSLKGHTLKASCYQAKNTSHLLDICKVNVDLPCERDPTHTIAMPCCDATKEKSSSTSYARKARPNCTFSVEVPMECGTPSHTKPVPCHEISSKPGMPVILSLYSNIDLKFCKKKKWYECPNGHLNELPCDATSECSVAEVAFCPNRGHQVEVPCAVLRQVTSGKREADAIAELCTASVEVSCPWGHTSCFECSRSPFAIDKCDPETNLSCFLAELTDLCARSEILSHKTNEHFSLQEANPNTCPLGHALLEVNLNPEKCSALVDTLCPNHSHQVEVPCHIFQHVTSGIINYDAVTPFCKTSIVLACPRGHQLRFECCDSPVSIEKCNEDTCLDKLCANVISETTVYQQRKPTNFHKRGATHPKRSTNFFRRFSARGRKVPLY